MKISNPNVPFPRQLVVRKKIEAKGRSHFIFYTGMVRWGFSMFVLTTLWSWHDKYGWHTPPRAHLFSNCVYVTFCLALWLTAGYFFGSRFWKKLGLEDSTTERINSQRPGSMTDAVIGGIDAVLNRLRNPH
jgi:hypothetical protein